MDYEKLDEIVAKLEKRHIVGSANGLAESKDILALTMYYQIQRANEDKTSNESEKFCNCRIPQPIEGFAFYTCATCKKRMH